MNLVIWLSCRLLFKICEISVSEDLVIEYFGAHPLSATSLDGISMGSGGSNVVTVHADSGGPCGFTGLVLTAGVVDESGFGSPSMAGGRPIYLWVDHQPIRPRWMKTLPFVHELTLLVANMSL